MYQTWQSILSVSDTVIFRIQTSHGITMLTDAIFAETNFADADMLVLPGGMPPYIDGNAVCARYNGVITSVELEAGDKISTMLLR